MMDYRLAGWRVRSALSLPELPAWPEDDHPVDVVIRFGAVPPTLPDPVHEGPVLQIGRDGICRFALPSVGAFLLRAGEEVVVDPGEGVAEADLRLFLLGSLFGLLCHQRGLLPLHASAVLIDGQAVAFAGPSGIGKSTLAAAFAARGYTVVADDVVVVDGSTGRPMVRPAIPRLRLWREAVQIIGRTTEGLERARARLDKFSIPVADGFPQQAVPLGAVFHLRNVNVTQLSGWQRLTGLAAVSQLRDAAYRSVMADRMGLAERIAAMAIRVSAGVALQAHLAQMPGFAHLPAAVAAVEEALGARG